MLQKGLCTMGVQGRYITISVYIYTSMYGLSKYRGDMGLYRGNGELWL